MDMYDAEWAELFRSFKGERPRINDGEFMCNSTLVSIMGRMSTYTGKTLTWDQVSNSQLDLCPPAYEFGEAPAVVIPRPGSTEFI